MCNWEGQGALLYRGKRWIGSRESSLPEYKRAPVVSRTCVSKFQIKSADSPLFLPNDSCNYYYCYIVIGGREKTCFSESLTRIFDRDTRFVLGTILGSSTMREEKWPT